MIMIMYYILQDECKRKQEAIMRICSQKSRFKMSIEDVDDANARSCCCGTMMAEEVRSKEE